MKINSLNNYNIQQSGSFKGSFLRTREFVKFRQGLNKADRMLLDEYLKNIEAFPDNVVYKYWTVSSYARISEAIGLREKEIRMRYRYYHKENPGNTQDMLVFRNPGSRMLKKYPLQIILKVRRGNRWICLET